MGKIKFTSPPVIELVIGAQFNSPVFDNEFIYNYYQIIKDDFPKIQENPPLPFIIEKKEQPNESGILQGFHSRRFFINDKGNKLLQMQPDKILFNWRKNSELEEYPSFSDILDLFNQFLTKVEESIPDITKKINQLEVTFVDQIFIDDFGLKTIQLNRVFNYLTFDAKVKGIQCNISFPHEEINGNLIFDLKSGHRKEKRVLT